MLPLIIFFYSMRCRRSAAPVVRHPSPTITVPCTLKYIFLSSTSVWLACSSCCIGTCLAVGGLVFRISEAVSPNGPDRIIYWIYITLRFFFSFSAPSTFPYSRQIILWRFWCWGWRRTNPHHVRAKSIKEAPSVGRSSQMILRVYTLFQHRLGAASPITHISRFSFPPLYRALSRRLV